MKRFLLMLCAVALVFGVCGVPSFACGAPAEGEAEAASADPSIGMTYYEDMPADFYQERIGEPVEIKTDGSIVDIADGIRMSFEGTYADDLYGATEFEFYVENKSQTAMYFYAPRMAVDGVELNHNMNGMISPHQRGFIYLETMQPFMGVLQEGAPHRIDFDLLLINYNGDFVYNNTVTCVISEDAQDEDFSLVSDDAFKLQTADVEVLGFTETDNDTQDLTFMLVAVKNTTDAVQAYKLTNVTFDECIGISTLGTWCEPGECALIVAYVNTEDFMDMAENPDEVAVAFNLESYTVGDDGAYVLTTDPESKEEVEIVVGPVNG